MPNIKIQRTGKLMFSDRMEILPAADLERCTGPRQLQTISEAT